MLKPSDDPRGGDIELPQVERTRWRWSSHTKFMMQAVGVCEGISNFYNFPNFLAKNGNGAFLIPYFLIKIFFAIPVTYMQLALGQFSEKGPLDVWILCPLSQGIGYAMLIMCWLGLVTNNALIVFSLYYFWSSFHSTLPWSHCDHDWAGENCMVRSENATTMASCIDKYNYSVCTHFNWQTASEYFWRNRLLENAQDHNFIDNGFGTLRRDLVLCLLLSCFLVFLVTARGLKTMEKIGTFTTVYPFIGLTLLLFATFLDAGAVKGLGFFLRSNFSALNTYQCWIHAFQSAALSMGCCYGVLITLGSYCTFRSPTNMDAITLNVVDILTTVAVGLVCFNCVGIIAYHFSIDPLQVVTSGHSIAFVIVPEALTYVPGSPHFWSLIYFSTMACFGIHTEYFLMASLLGVVYDRFPRTMQYKVLASAVASTMLFISGLTMCSTHSSDLLKLTDVWVHGPAGEMILLLQLFVVLWMYGLGRLSDDIHFMLGFRPSNLYQACWFLAPLLTLVMFVYECKHYVESFDDYKPQMYYIGWTIFYIISLGVVVLVAIIYVIIYLKKHKLRQVVKPVPEWGPTDPVLMKSRRMFSARAMTKEYVYRQSRLGARPLNSDTTE